MQTIDQRRGSPLGHRIPQQSRSRETVDRILAAAEIEIGEVGLAAATTTTIAKRAGVSVGALYRFFRDKDALAHALARSYLAEIAEPFEAAVGSVRTVEEIAQAMVALIELAARAQESHPGYYRLTEELGPELHESPAHAVRERLVDIFTNRLDAAGHDGAALRLVVELSIETVRHTLARAPREGEARAAVLRELELMLTSYVVARLPELG